MTRVRILKVNLTGRNLLEDEQKAEGMILKIQIQKLIRKGNTKGRGKDNANMFLLLQAERKKTLTIRSMKQEVGGMILRT